MSEADPFNCPKCGSHDYGLFAPQIGECPWCLKRNLDQREKQLIECQYHLITRNAELGTAQAACQAALDYLRRMEGSISAPSHPLFKQLESALKNAAPQVDHRPGARSSVDGDVAGNATPAVAAPRIDIQAGEHIETITCGFDRNASHSAGTYVCTCGWPLRQ